MGCDGLPSLFTLYYYIATFNFGNGEERGRKKTPFNRERPRLAAVPCRNRRRREVCIPKRRSPKTPLDGACLGRQLDGFSRQEKLLRRPCRVISQNGSAIITRARAIAKALRTFLGFCDNNCKRIQINPTTE